MIVLVDTKYLCLFVWFYNFSFENVHNYHVIESLGLKNMWQKKNFKLWGEETSALRDNNQITLDVLTV